MIAGSESRLGRRRRPVAAREVHHAHRVLDRHRLRPAHLLVELGASQAREDQRLPTVHEVAAVELGAHLHRQVAAPQPLRGVRRVGGGEREVAAHPDEHGEGAGVHGLDRLDGVEPPVPRGGDAARVFDEVAHLSRRVVVDAASAVALHVAVTAHRRRARPFAPEVAAEQQHVDDLADRVDAVLVLRDAEAPADEGAPRAGIDRRRATDLGSRQAGLRLQVGPGGRGDDGPIVLEPVGEPLDEHRVQAVGGGVLLQEHLGDPAHEGEVAAGAHLEVEGAGASAFVEGHVDDLVRHDRAGRGGLDHRVDVHDLGAAPIGVGQGREHPRSVGRRVDAHDEQRLRAVPVVEVGCALAGAERGLERPA